MGGLGHRIYTLKRYFNRIIQINYFIWPLLLIGDFWAVKVCLIFKIRSADTQELANAGFESTIIHRKQAGRWRLLSPIKNGSFSLWRKKPWLLKNPTDCFGAQCNHSTIGWLSWLVRLASTVENLRFSYLWNNFNLSKSLRLVFLSALYHYFLPLEERDTACAYRDYKITVQDCPT